MSWTLITQLRGMQERECASLGDMADQTAGRAADALEREMQRAEAAEARVKELEADIVGMEAFEKSENALLNAAVAERDTLREQNARLRKELGEIALYRAVNGDDWPASKAKAALGGEEASA